MFVYLIYMYQPIICLQGSYCPVGVSAPINCVPGKYGNTTGLVYPTDCLSCSAGHYCDGYGLTTPRGTTYRQIDRQIDRQKYKTYNESSLELEYQCLSIHF